MSGPQRFRAIWRRKPALRAIHGDFYRRIGAQCRPGRTLEIRGGGGNLEEFAPGVVSTEIVPVPWLDAVYDAHFLPFADGSFANIVLFDVPHHLERPAPFFAKAARVLEAGGRLVVCEPAITPFGGLVCRRFHQQPVDMRGDPLADGPLTPGRDIYESNRAVPTMLTGRDRDTLPEGVPDLPPISLETFSFAACILSGGFRAWSLLPAFMAGLLLRLEWAARRVFGPFAALRLLAVYAKRAPPALSAGARA